MTAGYVRVKDANDPLHDGPPRIRRVEILRNGTSRKVVTLDVASRTMQRVAIGASGKERRAPTDRLLVSVGGLGAAPPETTGTALQRQSPWRRSRSTRSGTTPRPRGPSRARRGRCRRSARERAVDGSEGGPPRVCVHGRGVRDRLRPRKACASRRSASRIATAMAWVAGRSGRATMSTACASRTAGSCPPRRKAVAAHSIEARSLQARVLSGWQTPATQSETESHSADVLHASPSARRAAGQMLTPSLAQRKAP